MINVKKYRSSYLCYSKYFPLGVDKTSHVKYYTLDHKFYFYLRLS